MEGYSVWDPSLVRGDDGRFHLFFSRWPNDQGWPAWISHSEVCRAAGETPLGPFDFAEVVLPRRPGHWDADNTHNPQVRRFGDSYYLLYNGNHAGAPAMHGPEDIHYGNEAWWHQRNNQRVGLAVACRPEGPWRRFDRPLIDVTPGSWDDVLTTNPSCCQTPDGRFLLVYKGVSSRNPAPYYGPVSHGVAFADDPEGPFLKHPKPIFTCEGIDFPCEDPFIWHEDGVYHAILKDMGTFYSSTERGLVRFRSGDVLDWTLAEEPVFCDRQLTHADGRREPVERIERPFMYLEDGRPRVFLAGVRPSDEANYSCVVAMGIV